MRWGKFVVHIGSVSTAHKTMCGITIVPFGGTETQHGGTVLVSVKQYLCLAKTTDAIYLYDPRTKGKTEPVCKSCRNTKEFGLTLLSEG